MIDVRRGSADDGFCTCTHCANIKAFWYFEHPGQSVALNRRSVNCGFGQGVYGVAKPTEELDCQEDLIINNFANQLNSFSDNFVNAYCQDTRRGW